MPGSAAKFTVLHRPVARFTGVGREGWGIGKGREKEERGKGRKDNGWEGNKRG